MEILPSLRGRVSLGCLLVDEVYLSILKAHRLSTVIPTEAFWTNGTSLHRVTPNGQSSARSWREIDGGWGVGVNFKDSMLSFQTSQKSSWSDLHSSVFLWTLRPLFQFTVIVFLFLTSRQPVESQEKTQLNLPITVLFMSALIEGLECKRRSIGIICGAASPPYHSCVSALVCNRVQLF